MPLVPTIYMEYLIYAFCAYDIHGKLNDSGLQLQLGKTFASSKACNLKFLLADWPHCITRSTVQMSNDKVTTFALNECLSAFLSASSPNYQNVPLIVRKLLAVTSIHKGDTYV
ncbi:hypothetical protein M0R45_031985 [Rubus argutus]|uniref:Uncharacterized protein n=1 Tax=Rubus argutus TaxID=59490 RepID=A0AAW1WIF1_RUBAR